MKTDLIRMLRCPQSGRQLILKNSDIDIDGNVRNGVLATPDNRYIYEVVDYIPRFVEKSNYADNFGMQWNKFSKTQLDSYSGLPISSERFWRATGWSPDEIKDQWVLDVGCGSGRFAEIALMAGANVVALDYSSAVDACWNNLKNHPRLHVVQGDIYALPFVKASFKYVYSLGVLQHTPDVERAFAALPLMVASGGYLCTDFYWRRLRTVFHPKYLLRPITRRLDQRVLFNYLSKAVPALLFISQFLGRMPVFGRLLKRLIPVADYTGIYPLNQRQLEEWALLDTFDMLGPRYDSPQTAITIRTWMIDAGMQHVEVLHVNLLVVRGIKT